MHSLSHISWRFAKIVLGISAGFAISVGQQNVIFQINISASFRLSGQQKCK